MSRRIVLRQFTAFGLAVGPSGAALAACGNGSDGDRPGMDGGMNDDMPDGMMDDGMMDDGMMDDAMMDDMRVIRDLLTDHDQIRRTVEDIDGGIRSVTTSADSQIAELIRSHVQAMRERLEDERPIRKGDPLFQEIFEHHAAIVIDIVELPDGVEVTETSADAQVELLIRQHAHRAVSEFVESGMQRAMQPTPLPDGYDG